MLQDANSGPVQRKFFILIYHNMVSGFSESIIWKHCNNKILKKDDVKKNNENHR